MADPWDERYIYLHENHINQPNVGLNIPGPYILWVCLLILISALLLSCVFLFLDFFPWHVDEPEPSSTGLLSLRTSWVEFPGLFFDRKQNNKSKPWKV